MRSINNHLEIVNLYIPIKVKEMHFLNPIRHIEDGVQIMAFLIAKRIKKLNAIVKTIKNINLYTCLKAQLVSILVYF